MKELGGIGVSKGIALGEVFKIDVPRFNVTEDELTSQQVVKSLSVYKQATKKAVSKLKKTIILAEKKFGKDEGEIFRSHVQILEDPTLSQKIISLIKDKHVNCARAIEIAFNEVRNLFANLEDPYLKERSNDVEDVMNILLGCLFNQEQPNLLLLKKPVILIVHELKPSLAALVNPKYVKGIVAEVGGKTSHAAFIIQSINVPAVFGVGKVLDIVKQNEMIAIDGLKGEVYSKLNSAEQKEIATKIVFSQKYQHELQKYSKIDNAFTKDDHKIIVAANVGSADDVESALKCGSNSVGLFRTEFLYIDSPDWPTEEKQFNVYKEILVKAKNKPVVIRTLDIGGDKMLNYFKFDKEENPFLGFRAIRFCLKHKDVFRVQLRALIRASVFGKLHIMFPLITTIDELLKAKKIFQKEYQILSKELNIKQNNIKLGMMIEVPAAAILANEFAKHVDFFSIGTNDLIQYTLACDRTSEKVSYLFQDTNPSVLRLIKFVIDSAHANKIWTGICGGMASNPLLIPLLIGMGLDEFSMSINSILENKKIISLLTYQECCNLAEKVLTLPTSDKIYRLLSNFVSKKRLNF